jgi:hypothetical protein
MSFGVSQPMKIVLEFSNPSNSAVCQRVCVPTVCTSIAVSAYFDSITLDCLGADLFRRPNPRPGRVDSRYFSRSQYHRLRWAGGVTSDVVRSRTTNPHTKSAVSLRTNVSLRAVICEGFEAWKRWRPKKGVAGCPKCSYKLRTRFRTSGVRCSEVRASRRPGSRII